ncbi:MAG: hypothetical protein E6J41_08955 [Chloroflexi bacterium]|nr:MAG: hypothetical protein E6J41_08955 [Chloroflexota bacterium]
MLLERPLPGLVGLDDDVPAVLEPQPDDDADGLLGEERARDPGAQDVPAGRVQARGDGGGVAGREHALLDGGVTVPAGDQPGDRGFERDHVQSRCSETVPWRGSASIAIPNRPDQV